jgi:hypothetical protein
MLLNALNTKSGKAARREQQDYQSITQYGNADFWKAFTNQEASMMSKGELLAELLVVLGCVNPTEPCLKYEASLWMLASLGESTAMALSSIEKASHRDKLREILKRGVRANKNSLGPYMTKLPQSFEEFKRDWPQVHAKLYGQSPPVRSPIDEHALLRIDGMYKCRNNSAGASALGAGGQMMALPDMPAAGMGQMGQMLGMVMQNMNSMIESQRRFLEERTRADNDGIDITYARNSAAGTLPGSRRTHALPSIGNTGAGPLMGVDVAPPMDKTPTKTGDVRGGLALEGDAPSSVEKTSAHTGNGSDAPAEPPAEIERKPSTSRGGPGLEGEAPSSVENTSAHTGNGSDAPAQPPAKIERKPKTVSGANLLALLELRTSAKKVTLKRPAAARHDVSHEVKAKADGQTAMENPAKQLPSGCKGGTAMENPAKQLPSGSGGKRVGSNAKLAKQVSPKPSGSKGEARFKKPGFSVEWSRNQVMCRTGLRGTGQSFRISFGVGADHPTVDAAVDAARAWVEKAIKSQSRSKS